MASRGMNYFLVVVVVLFSLLWLLVAQPYSDAFFNWRSKRKRNEPSASTSILAEHVRMLADPAFPRDYEHRPNLDRAASYIKKQFNIYTRDVTEQELFVDDWKADNRRVRLGPYRNISAHFGPAAGQRLVIGAHYDVCGPFPGADDNASGMAVLLELARLLSAKPPAIPVELVAYTLEEPPYFATPSMGSVAHARLLKSSGVPVKGVIVLETLGYFSEAPRSQLYPMMLLQAFYPSVGNYVAVVGGFHEFALTRRVKKSLLAIPELRVRSINAPASIPGIDFSDHRSYWQVGIPAIMITDTAFFRNRRYHTAEDTPDTLNYDRMANITDGVRQAVEDLSQ